ncbi:MAG: aminotransferase class V-fold PLP-dependent enzyme, partial [Acidimicrobiales bacterium]
MPRHYLDHASTSPPRPEVVQAMVGWLSTAGSPAVDTDGPGAADPGRVHTEGRLARAVVEDARRRLAALLGTRPRQVIFTSGGTEAVNAAVWGATRARPGHPVLLGGIEHSSVRDASRRLAPVVDVAVDIRGRLDVAMVGELVTAAVAGGRPPALVHCQAANHEVGTLQPVADVVALCRPLGVP